MAAEPGENRGALAISPGAKLDGKYQVRCRLGSGGFGDVFLADDEVIPGRQVAIKVLRRGSSGAHQELIREMQTLARLAHPGVVTFYHHFRAQEQLCLAMEYCAGGSLRQRMHTGARAEDEVMAWGLRLCQILDYVHDKGIVHHDIKPENILFTDNTTLKLGDFGVANRSIGTLLYQPPSVLLGERGTKTDVRVDVYALGLTLLECLLGKHPFEELSYDDAIRARLAQDFVPGSLPRWVQELLLKATHPTAELRFQTVRDFGEAIRGKRVPYIFDGTRIRAHALAARAAEHLSHRRWKSAAKLAEQALHASPDCVAALLVAGRTELALRRTARATEFLRQAIAVNPRVHVQRELGWLQLEQGQWAQAISLLTDHLQREASDYEAFNLLLKCFYLTECYEAGVNLARTLLREKVPNGCFRCQEILCRMMLDDLRLSELNKLCWDHNPWVAYNATVIAETPPTWTRNGSPTLKSKLLFQEYRFGAARRPPKANKAAIQTADGRREVTEALITFGASPANDFVLRGAAASRRHAVLVNLPGDVWLYDLGSTVGTLVDGSPVAGCVFLDGRHAVRMGRADMEILANTDLLL